MMLSTQFADQDAHGPLPGPPTDWPRRRREHLYSRSIGVKRNDPKNGGFLLTLQQKIKKLAGGAAGAGRRWLRRLRSQTQALTAQEATFEGRGEREEISLRQCVLLDHQIRSGSGLFIHSASTHHYTNRSVGQAPRLHRRIWQRRRCLHSDNVDANLKNCSGIIKDEGGWCS